MTRLSITFILLFAILVVVAYGQETLVMEGVETETAATATATAEETDELNLDALLEEADREIVEATADLDAATNTEETTTTEASTEETTTTTTETSAGEGEEAQAEAETTSTEADAGDATTTTSATAEQEQLQAKLAEQAGPFVDLFGPQLYSLQMIDQTQAQLVPQFTNDALKGKKVVGVYFSADWCGPCRKFTPELTSFYDKINSRRGRQNEFEIIWVSRCRDVQSYGQYFTHMKWLALPPDEAMGQRGQMLSAKFKVKSIPTFVLLDDLGNVITLDGRNKIPADRAGIGFPWRNPIAQLYITIIPKSLRLMVKGQVDTIKGKLVQRAKGLVGMKSKA